MNTTADLVARLRSRAQEELSGGLSELAPEDAEARAWALLVELVESETRQLVLAGQTPVSSEERSEIAQTLFDLFFRLGPLQRFVDDEDIEEVVVNASDRGFIVRSGGVKEPIDPGLSSEDEVRALLARVVARSGRRIDESSRR